MLLKLKIWAAAAFAAIGLFFTAKYYRGRAIEAEERLEKEQTKSQNVQSQINAIHKTQQHQKDEIQQALSDDSYLDYFDDKHA